MRQAHSAERASTARRRCASLAWLLRGRLCVLFFVPVRGALFVDENDTKHYPTLCGITTKLQLPADIRGPGAWHSLARARVPYKDIAAASLLAPLPAPCALDALTVPRYCLSHPASGRTTGIGIFSRDEHLSDEQPQCNHSPPGKGDQFLCRNRTQFR